MKTCNEQLNCFQEVDSQFCVWTDFKEIVPPDRRWTRHQRHCRRINEIYPGTHFHRVRVLGYLLRQLTDQIRR